MAFKVFGFLDSSERLTAGAGATEIQRATKLILGHGVVSFNFTARKPHHNILKAFFGLLFSRYYRFGYYSVFVVAHTQLVQLIVDCSIKCDIPM